MSRKGKRRTVQPNVYADDRGLEVVARIGNRAKSGRLPHGSTQGEIAATYARLTQP